MYERESDAVFAEIVDPSLRFEEGWREILEAPDAIDYQTWLSDLTDLSRERLDKIVTEETALLAWLRALEQVADIVIDPAQMTEMTQAEIVETALITLKFNLDHMGWDDEGLIFTVPNMFTEQEATIDLWDLINNR